MAIAALHLHLHLHLHLLHHLRGATIDYVAVAVAAFVSWVLGAGPGEPVLIAAGVFAAKHKLDIAPLVFWAWVGATAGGVVGWLAGLKAGRSILLAPGPLHSLRERAAQRGEAMFKRREVVAIILTPPWVAGLNRSSARVYLPVNVLQALLLWAAPLGVGAYYAGPPVLDVFGDAGTLASIFVVLVVVGSIVSALLHRRAGIRARIARDEAAQDMTRTGPTPRC